MANTERMNEALRGIENPQDMGQALGALARQCRDDPDMRRQLDEDPRAFFSEHALDFPEGIDFKVETDTPEVFHLVLPPDPNAVLADHDLSQISGGTPKSTLSSFPSTISTRSSVGN